METTDLIRSNRQAAMKRQHAEKAKVWGRLKDATWTPRASVLTWGHYYLFVSGFHSMRLPRVLGLTAAREKAIINYGLGPPKALGELRAASSPIPSAAVLSTLRQ